MAITVWMLVALVAMGLMGPQLVTGLIVAGQALAPWLFR